MSKQFKVVGICGSLRKESTNLTALKLVGTLSPRLKLDIVNYEDVPLYNQDVEAKGLPTSVTNVAA